METKKTPQDYNTKPVQIPAETHALIVEYWGKGRISGAISELVKAATCQHPKEDRVMVKITAGVGADTVPATGFYCPTCKAVVSNLGDML